MKESDKVLGTESQHSGSLKMGSKLKPVLNSVYAI